MAVKEEPASDVVVTDKGLQAGALGLVGNVVIGLAAVAPAYSLAATLGYVVGHVQEKAPAMFVLALRVTAPSASMSLCVLTLIAPSCAVRPMVVPAVRSPMVETLP